MATELPENELHLDHGEIIDAHLTTLPNGGFFVQVPENAAGFHSRSFERGKAGLRAAQAYYDSVRHWHCYDHSALAAPQG